MATPPVPLFNFLHVGKKELLTEEKVIVNDGEEEEEVGVREEKFFALERTTLFYTRAPVHYQRRPK